MKKFIWLLILVFFMGCMQPIRSGKIISRNFVPAHTESFTTFNIVTETMETIDSDIPDAWYITIENQDEQNQVRQRVVEVSKETFQSLDIGEWYVVRD